ncbi:hypothetical protein BGZ98_002108 [Dissophora globulifera]|nr:hypothetical protein BGZ98_002108 [Dissophora globulifera]
MFDTFSRNALPPNKALELIQTLLITAHECRDADIKMVLCSYVDTLLSKMKRTLRGPFGIIGFKRKNGDRVLRDGIAAAYLDLANLLADLRHPDLALRSRQRAGKWSGAAQTKIDLGVDTAAHISVTSFPYSIFPEDVTPPSLQWTFPAPDGRIADTPQLVSCLSLLKHAPNELPGDALDPTARKWLKEVTENADEKERLETLATALIRAFTRDEIKDKKVVSEILCLVPVLDIADSPILDLVALRGLAQLVKSASLGYLHPQDLVEILVLVSSRLQKTHMQSPDHIFELTVAVSSVLDAMADIKVVGLNRVNLHEPLFAFLRNLQGSSDPHLKYYASYAFQALLCVPDDESPWQATLRRTTDIVKGISGMVSAVKKLDLNDFMIALQNIQQGLEGISQVFDLAKMACEGVSPVYDGEQDLFASLKEGFTFNRKQSWYSALRGSDTLIEGGELAKLRILVCDAPCRQELAFQWGVCQRMANLAVNVLWDIKTRQGAIQFLGEIYRRDLVWGQLPRYSQAVIRNRQRSPRTDVEVDLRRMARLRTKERDGTLYISPMAKANLQASDDDHFKLIPAVDNFLNGYQKVLLLLRDFGIGKTTFNRELDLKLWKAYKPKTGQIPLLISLPAIERPEKDLIAKYLRICEFSEPQIRELKSREFVIICDGYDESQQTHNLYEANGFNVNAGWRVKMIVSCRSEHLGQDYRDLFQPARANPSDSDPFLEAVFVPFLERQIKDYIKQYVDIKKPLWEASDYECVLDQIPSLQELVKNPFLLSLSLEVLPRLMDPSQKVTSNRITRVLLYDEFVAQWLERNKMRLANKELSDKEKVAFESLSDDGFTQQGLVYLRDLAAAIYKEQGGNPIVEYSKARDTKTWKEPFFGRLDDEKRLLRRAVPLTRNGSRFGFIHRSILEYGVSRAIFEPLNGGGLRLKAVKEAAKRRKSLDSALSFELDDVVEDTVGLADLAILGPDPDSLLVKKSFVKETSILQFLVERVESELVFKDQLLAYIKASKTEKKWRTAAANAITILIRAGVNFSNYDLSGIQVPGADLSFGVFDSAQLEGADLRKTRLHGVWLRQANLSNAQMDSVIFGELPALSVEERVSSFSYSPNGKTFAVCTLSGRVLFYNTTTWAVSTTHDMHSGSPVDVFVFSSDGSMAAAASGLGREVLLWDVATGHCFHLPQEHEGLVRVLRFSHCGRQLALGGDGPVELWDVKTGTRNHAFDVPAWHIVHSRFIKEGQRPPPFASVIDIAYAPKGMVLASCQKDGTIRLCNPVAGECLRVLSGKPVESKGMAFSPDGHKILSFCRDASITIWDVDSGVCFQILAACGPQLESVSYLPNRQHVVFGLSDGSIKLWDSTTHAFGATIQGHHGAVFSSAYSSDGLQIVTGGEDKTVRLWDAHTGTPGPVLSGHGWAVKHVAFSPILHQVASCCKDGTGIKRWDTQISAITSQRQQSSRHGFKIKQVLCPSASQHIISCSQESVRVWDKKAGKLYRLFRVYGSKIEFIAASPCGLQVAALVSDGSFRLWEARTNNFSLIVECGTRFPSRMAYSPDGMRIVLADSDGVVKILNWRTGSPEHCFNVSFSASPVFSFSPKGDQLAISHGGGKLDIWDVQSGQQHTHTMRESEVISMIVFSRDGNEVITGCTNGRTRIWDIATETCIHMVEASGETPFEISADEGKLVSKCQHGKLQVWDIRKGERIWTLETPDSSEINKTCLDGHILTSSSRNGTSIVQFWDLRTGQEVGRRPTYRGRVSTLSLHTVGEDRFIAIGRGDGDIGFWTLVKVDGLGICAQEKDTGGIIKSSGNNNNLESIISSNSGTTITSGSTSGSDDSQERLKPTLLWSTAYGKLNAQGASIHGVSGLSSTNMKLLKQKGAVGDVHTAYSPQNSI